jgi:hypothetical protein
MDQGIILNGARHVLDESGRRGWATPAEWDEEGGSLLPPPQESGAWASSSVASPLASVYASCNRIGRPSVGASLEERRAAAMLRVINLRVGREVGLDLAGPEANCASNLVARRRRSHGRAPNDRIV